jgi:hypothetical protein
VRASLARANEDDVCGRDDGESSLVDLGGLDDNPIK